jgi:hypothetical protein
MKKCQVCGHEIGSINKCQECGNCEMEALLGCGKCTKMRQCTELVRKNIKAARKEWQLQSLNTK